MANEEKLGAYLVYESWVAAGRQLDRELWHDLRDRIDDYAFYGIKNLDGLKIENARFLETIFKQIDLNLHRYNIAKENGSKSPGATPKSDYALEREMLEFGLTGAEIGRYYGVKGNTITQNTIYLKWKQDGCPAPNKPKNKKGKPTAKDFCDWKGIPFEPVNAAPQEKIVNNQEIIPDQNAFLDENGKWNF